MLELNKIHAGDALKLLRKLADKSVQCIVTSPPYWGLRDYGVKAQLGMEETPDKYVRKMVLVFKQCMRVLKNDGVLWLNIGDSYYGSNKGNNDHTGMKYKQGTNKGSRHGNIPVNKICGLKPKDLVGIPWMVAFALRSAGWYLRQDNIWSKPNPMPESVKDRCTKAHEYLFLLTKSKNYYYNADAIKQPVADSTVQRLAQQIEQQNGSGRVPGKINGNMKAVGPGRNPRKGIDTHGNQGSETGIPAMAINGNGVTGHSGYFDRDGKLIGNGLANKKSVWTVSTKPFKEAHFATFPPELIIDCIKAGSKEDDIVLDPFMGGGTTALVARKLNRNFIGFELNEKYITIANKRLRKELSMFQ